MIIGAHSIVYSKDPDADRAFLRDVLGLTHVDVGDGWLIFGLPPAEVAVHPSKENDVHEFYLMCSDVDAFVARMQGRGTACDAVQDLGWGRLTSIALPGGGKLGVYEPRHARPEPMRAGKAEKAAKKAKKAARKAEKAAKKAVKKAAKVARKSNAAAAGKAKKTAAKAAKKTAVKSPRGAAKGKPPTTRE